MAEEIKTEQAARPPEPAGRRVAAGPAIHVAPGPHLTSTALTPRRMMLDVLIALLPVVAMSVWLFRWHAVVQIGISVLSCLAAEAVFTAVRRRAFSLGDGSAAVTGVILGLSLPGPAPWHVGVIAGVAAIGLGKFIFGGLGYNIFNPAMVGRAFVMIAFAAAMAAGGYVVTNGPSADVLTQATPMTAYKTPADKPGHDVTPLGDLVVGDTNGSLGEVSALACLLGGLYLMIRRTAAWQIPVGVLAAAGAIGLLTTWGATMALLGKVFTGDLAGANDLLVQQWTVLHHLAGGALLFGAMFIATDPVSSPVSPKGRLVFGLGVGALVMLMRTLSAYPEGVMFAVLLMNGLVPLINRWTVPTPVGGPGPQPAGT